MQRKYDMIDIKGGSINKLKKTENRKSITVHEDFIKEAQEYTG